jgi:integrase
MIARDNYLKVKEHLLYLHEVLQVQPVSVERYWAYLRHLLLWLDEQPLAKADRIRPTFPVYVSTLPGKDGAPALALESQKTILEVSRRFFVWAKGEGFLGMQTLPQSWIETLRVAPNASEAPRSHVYVTEEEIRQIAKVPAKPGDLVMLRDKEAACMLFLSGARAAAFTTLPIQAVSMENHSIDQFPSLGVRTKMNRTRTTFMLQIPELLEVVREWDTLVRAELPPSCPWYAVIKSSWGEQRLSDHNPGSNRAISLDKRLRWLMTSAGVAYKSAHKFRHGHALYGLLHARTPADFKALSMNLMHSSTRITDETYAFLAEGDVREHILHLAANPIVSPNGELEAIIRSSGREELGHALEVIAEMIAG